MTSTAGRVAQEHYWSLTRKRIGTRFFGLDPAGNVLFYPFYRTTRLGGWFPVTLVFETTKPQTLVMEDGYPMHHKSSTLLQQLVLQKRKEREQEMIRRIQEEVASRIRTVEGEPREDEGSSTASLTGDKTRSGATAVDDESTFTQELLREYSSPQFMKQRMRVNRVTTGVYLCCYYGLWAFGTWVCLQLYHSFKRWLNPPARQGLCHLEDKALYYPRAIASLLDEYLFSTSWCQAVICYGREHVADPVRQAVNSHFARYTWSQAHKRRIRQELEATHQQELAEREKQRRVWWERSIVSLLLAIIFVCLL